MKGLMMVIVLGLAAGAQAAEAGPGGKYPPEFSGPAVRASDLKALDAAIAAVPAPSEDEETLRLRAEALADPGKFVDEHTPDELGMAFGLFPSRYQILDAARIQNAAVKLTVDLTRQRLEVKSPKLNTEFKISSGLLPAHGTPGSGKCYGPDSVESMHYSSLYNNAPMPNTVFFNGNIALHGTSAANEALLGKPASHGCVRLSRANSRIVFNLVRENGKPNVVICVKGAAPR